ncbi:MAG: DUF1957 domain-containing protein, partial [Armatimonadota bacterium]|nr:DUF1957 domain-containing protein [Armatimonadota bacterium]
MLHAHVPYVLPYDRWPSGADWLYEAVAETYIPLLNAIHRLLGEGLTPRVTISFTPILCEMLDSLTFADGFQNYLNQKTADAAQTAREFAEQGLEAYRDIALSWESWYTNIARDFEQYNRAIIDAFRRLQDGGHIEIITSAATHAYLPLLGTDEAVQAQVRLGVDTYKRHFGRQPRGIWLPECAYRPRGAWTVPNGDSNKQPVLRQGIDEFLAENHLEYFIADASAPSTSGDTNEDSDGRSPHEVYRLASVGAVEGNPPLACFVRDETTSRQVWNVEHGYPQNAAYLERHRKHYPSGLHLWRVTSAEADLAQKEPYDLLQIRENCEAQAHHFVGLVKDELRTYREQSGRSGIVCCACDARLFGQWWFEAPNWLTRVLRKMAQDPEIELTTGGQYLTSNPPSATIALQEGSWGEGGSHGIWLNPATAWTWHEIYSCESTMTRLARQYGNTRNPKLREILQQCARELLLLESSDWQFLITTVTARE